MMIYDDLWSVICETGMPALVATDGSFQHSRKIIRRLARDFKGRTAADRQEKQLRIAQLPTAQLHSYPNSNEVLDQIQWAKMEGWTKHEEQLSLSFCLAWDQTPEISRTRSHQSRGRRGRRGRHRPISVSFCRSLYLSCFAWAMGPWQLNIFHEGIAVSDGRDGRTEYDEIHHV